MNSKYLEYFLRVADTGSINRAATELKISQPSLSRSISLLEHEMGSALFIRSRHGVSLTEPGKLLLDQATPLLRQFSILKEQIGDMARGQVAVGIPPAWRAVLTLELAETILQEEDGIQVRIDEAVSHALRRGLDSGEIDMCIAPTETNSTSEHRQTPIIEEPIVLVGGAETELCEDSPITIAALDKLPLLIPARPNTLRTIVEQAFAINQIDLNVAIETNVLSLCLAMAARGSGYTITPRSALLSHPQSSMVRWAPIETLVLRWALYENKKRAHSQAVRKCRRLILEICARNIESGDWTGALGLHPPANTA